MDETQRLALLEATLVQMLKPIRNIPLYIVIQALCKKKVLKFDAGDRSDQKLLEKLRDAILICGREVDADPIRRPRPNEVGNDIESYVFRALKSVGLDPRRPTSSKGRAQATGYPDILLFDEDGRPTYLECKIFAEGTDPGTMRSFYLSPSETPKVSLDARHLLLAFGMEAAAIPGTREALYKPRSFKLVDLHDLLCDVKYEFNSDNRRLYSPDLLLLEGRI